MGKIHQEFMDPIDERVQMVFDCEQFLGLEEQALISAKPLENSTNTLQN